MYLENANFDKQEKTIKILFITSDTEYLYNNAKSLKIEAPRIDLQIVHSSDIILPLLYMGHKEYKTNSDLILLDSSLDENDLKILLNYFHTNAEFSNIPQVLIVSSFEEKEKLYKSGIQPDCFIPHSFDVSKLLNLIYSSRSFWLSVIRSQTVLGHNKDHI